METPETSACYPSVDRTTTPEASVALGVSSNSPCVNGQAQEDTIINEDSLSPTEEVADVISSTEKKSLAFNEENISSTVRSIFTAGTKRPKPNRTTATSSKPYPFMGYQILPIIPQPVLFPIMSKDYHQSVQQQSDPLSTTNLYIKGLPDNYTDNDLEVMCKQYGKIVSTKAILDKKTGICKGYGFVDFQDPSDAQKAVQSLQNSGILAQFAKLQEQDPTNLYMSNLPKNYTEKHLEQMLTPYGSIVSSRILRDLGGSSRGVGFVRLDSHEHCHDAIEKLAGTVLPGLCEPLNIKFADGSTNKKKVQTGNWKDFDMLAWKDYGVQDQYVYDVPPVLTHNGYVSSRLMPHGGVVSGSPFMQPSSQISGYQNQTAATNSSWSNQGYYISPGNMNGNDHVHGLTSQMNALQMSSNSNGSNSYSTAHHDQQYTLPSSGTTNGGHASSQIPTHTAQYTQQPPGWTIRLSHPPAHYIQQHT